MAGIEAARVTPPLRLAAPRVRVGRTFSTISSYGQKNSEDRFSTLRMWWTIDCSTRHISCFKFFLGRRPSVRFASCAVCRSKYSAEYHDVMANGRLCRVLIVLKCYKSHADEM